MTDNQITITFPVSEAAKQHIEHLQATLTKRNAQIEQLSQRLEGALSGEPNQTAMLAEYRRGWQDAANHLMNTTQQAAVALGKVRKDAFAIYLEGNEHDHC